MKKRVITVLLILAIFLSMGNTTVCAEDLPIITIESVDSHNGQTVSVQVTIENNPGIWGMDLRISYDKNALKLIGVENGDFFKSSEWTEGNLNGDVYILSYESDDFADNVTSSGILATLNFEVCDTAPTGEYFINASYAAGDIINVSFEDVTMKITQGKICVTDDIPGDVNEDGFVDNEDVAYLLWYTLFPEDYPVYGNADFDKNGIVNNKDVEYLLWHTLFPEDYPL